MPPELDRLVADYAVRAFCAPICALSRGHDLPPAVGRCGVAVGALRAVPLRQAGHLRVPLAGECGAPRRSRTPGPHHGRVQCWVEKRYMCTPTLSWAVFGWWVSVCCAWLLLLSLTFAEPISCVLGASLSGGRQPCRRRRVLPDGWLRLQRCRSRPEAVGRPKILSVCAAPLNSIASKNQSTPYGQALAETRGSAGLLGWLFRVLTFPPDGTRVG